MTVSVGTDFGEGGANFTDEHGEQAQTGDALRASVDDVTELRTQFIALLAKLDADSGDTGGDSDYASTLTPAEQTLVKGA